MVVVSFWNMAGPGDSVFQEKVDRCEEIRVRLARLWKRIMRVGNAPPKFNHLLKCIHD